MDGETSKDKVQLIRDSNKSAILKMWNEARSAIQFRSNTPESRRLAFKSSEQSVVLPDGKLFPVMMNISGTIGTRGDHNFVLSLSSTTDTQKVAHRRYYFKVESSKAIFETYVQVNQVFDRIGIGSALIGLDEDIETLMVTKINEELGGKITQIEQIYVDGTTDQNRMWTERRFQNDHRFTQVDVNKWIRTMLVGRQ